MQSGEFCFRKESCWVPFLALSLTKLTGLLRLQNEGGRAGSPHCVQMRVVTADMVAPQSREGSQGGSSSARSSMLP